MEQESAVFREGALHRPEADRLLSGSSAPACDAAGSLDPGEDAGVLRLLRRNRGNQEIADVLGAQLTAVKSQVRGMVIQGKTSAKAIVCGSGSANKVLTLTGAGYVIGACSLNGTATTTRPGTVDIGVALYSTADDAGTAGIVNWPSDGLDLSSYTTKTTFLTDSGTAVWQPTMDGSTFKSGTLTLNGAQTDAILALPDCDVTIALGNAASRTGEISVSQSLTAARALTISGPGSLAADGINISNNTYSCALTINGGAQVTSSKGISGGSSGSLTVTGSGTKLTATDAKSGSYMKDLAVTDHALASFTGNLMRTARYVPGADVENSSTARAPFSAWTALSPRLSRMRFAISVLISLSSAKSTVPFSFFSAVSDMVPPALPSEAEPIPASAATNEIVISVPQPSSLLTEIVPPMP